MVTRACAVAAIALAVTVSPSLAGNQAATRPVVRRGDYLVSDTHGYFRILDARGKLVRRLSHRIARFGPRGLELSRDRRFAYVPLRRIYPINLATGRKTRIASGDRPAVSPDGTRLAYFSYVRRNDISYKDALVVRSLDGHDAQSIALGGDDVGAGPLDAINWSPDGRRLVIIDHRSLRIVTLGPGGLQLSAPVASGLSAPVFLDQHTLVAVANCCIGNIRLLTIDLRSGARHPFAVLPAPPETIRRLRSGVLFVVTASDKLLLVSHNHAKAIAKGVTAADR
jgi:hypothetical protein